MNKKVFVPIPNLKNKLATIYFEKGLEILPDVVPVGTGNY